MKTTYIFLLCSILYACSDSEFTHEITSERIQSTPTVSDEISTAGSAGLGDDMPQGLNGWSRSGTIQTRSSNNNISCQANFAEGRFGPGPYTVQFGISNMREGVPAIGRFFPNPIATITWRVAGNFVKRTVSVGNGTQVSGTGESVSVVLSDPDLISPASPSIYDASILITPGTRPNVQQPAQYVPFITGATVLGSINLAGLSSVSVPIPQDYGIISVFSTALATSGGPLFDGDVTIGMYTMIGGLIKLYDPRVPQWVPIPPSATSILLSNTTAAKSTQFSLTFGVDG
jgi:hypothetical protein